MRVRLCLPIIMGLVFSVALARARDLHREYERAQFKVGAKAITAFVADTDQLRAEGLMFVERLQVNEGMLFIFEDEERLSFWMKNTLIPLSIGFFNSKGRLVDIQEMQVPSLLEGTPRSYQSRAPALFALEMNAGWFKRNRISKGAQLTALGPVKSNLWKIRSGRAVSSLQPGQ